MDLLTFSLLIIALLFLRVPVAFAFLIPSLLYILDKPAFPIGAAIQQVSIGLESFVLIVVPMFILMGNLANAIGATERLFNLIQALIGHVRGSLGYVNVWLSMTFSWMSGVAVADAAALSRIQVPVMRRAGYPFGFSVGLTAASSLMGAIMPPSLPAVIYAVTAGVSLGAMLLAGILPALMITFVLTMYVYVWARKRPHLRQPRAGRDELVRALISGVPVLVTPVILVGGILGGVVTPTEASALAVLWMLLLAALFRTISWRDLFMVIRQTAETTGGVMLIVATSQLAGYVLTLERAPTLVAQLFLGVTDNQYIFLLLLNIILLLAGIFFELSAMIVVLVAILLPVSTAYGIDPIHLGVILIFNFLIGSVSPPVGLILTVISSALKEPMSLINRGVIPALIPLGICLLLITFVPALSLWLPTALGLAGSR
jgi:tripartite ATP-independent transporter DctM subunit